MSKAKLDLAVFFARKSKHETEKLVAVASVADFIAVVIVVVASVAPAAWSMNTNNEALVDAAAAAAERTGFAS